MNPTFSLRKVPNRSNNISLHDNKVLPSNKESDEFSMLYDFYPFLTYPQPYQMGFLV